MRLPLPDTKIKLTRFAHSAFRGYSEKRKQRYDFLHIRR